MNVTIEPLRKEHADISWEWRNNPKVWEMTGSRPDRHITAEIENAWIEKALLRPNEKRFAILADGVYVGNVQLTSIAENEAEFHIFIGDTSYWGKGIGYMATSLMLKDAFEKFGLKKVYLFVNKKNLSALAVYKKNGFVETGETETEIKMEVCAGLEL